MKRLFLIFCLLVSVRAEVEFDGVDDILNISSGSTLTSRTISFWVRPYILSGIQGILAENAYNYHLLFSNASFQVYWHNGANSLVVTSCAFGPANVWKHVAVTINVSGSDVTVVIFVDGVEQTRVNGVAGFTSKGPFISLGKANVYELNGVLTEFQIYNRAVSAAEVAILAKSRVKGPKFSGLVHYWPLDDGGDGMSGNGVVFKDRVGSGDATGNHGANATGLTGRAESFLSYP